MIYKLRAECTDDVVILLNNISDDLTSFTLKKPDKELPDVEFEFETDLTLNGLRSEIAGIDDNHVMYQTVLPIAEYTGQRNYKLEYNPLNLKAN